MSRKGSMMGSSKYELDTNGLDYCCHCMLSVLVDDGVIEIASYNEEYKRLCETLESIK